MVKSRSSNRHAVKKQRNSLIQQHAPALQQRSIDPKDQQHHHKRARPALQQCSIRDSRSPSAPHLRRTRLQQGGSASSSRLPAIIRRMGGLEKRDELIVSGIPYLPEENLVKYFKAMWKEVGLSESSTPLIDTRRLKSSTNGDGVVLLQFALRNIRDDFYNNYLKKCNLKLPHLGRERCLTGDGRRERCLTGDGESTGDMRRGDSADDDGDGRRERCLTGDGESTGDMRRGDSADDDGDGRRERCLTGDGESTGDLRRGDSADDDGDGRRERCLTGDGESFGDMRRGDSADDDGDG
ncbi:hypothetical protein pipiens_007337 [Culex pipiens pipiens]|uniref:Uncharacterized protein n=1 Tax=Culex pipiens pipiens TaxID=38569 RepID=A0ABD1DLX7_CULPP